METVIGGTVRRVVVLLAVLLAALTASIGAAGTAAASSAPAARPDVTKHVLLPTKVIDLRQATAASGTTYRQPSSGSYDCGGIPLAWWHQTDTTTGQTRHRIESYYGGTGVTNPSTTQRHWDLVHVTFREQYLASDGKTLVSLGGEDYYLSDNSGFWDSGTSFTTAPWNPGPTYFAIRIDYIEGITKYTQPCTYKI